VDSLLVQRARRVRRAFGRVSTPTRVMASVEEVTELLASTTALLLDFASKGASIFLAEALAPAATSNIMDKPEGEIAALLAGSVVRQAVGGSTYIVSADPARVFVDTTGGGRGIRVMHPTLGAQCIPTTALRHYSGFLVGVALPGALFSSHGFPATVDFVMSDSTTDIREVNVTVEALFTRAQTGTTEDFATRVGAQWVPFASPVDTVDPGVAQGLLVARSEVPVPLSGGSALTSVLVSLSGAAGRALVSPGDVTNVASITNFVSALCGLQMTEEMMVAVGTAEQDVHSGAPARYGMGGFARVATRLGEAMQEISSRLSGGWDSLVIAALRELQGLPAAAKSNAARAAGSVLRRHLLAANWTPLPTPSRVIATTACAQVPVSSVGGGWEEGRLPVLAPAASMPGGLFDVSDLSPEAARTLATLLARQRANKRSLAEALTDPPLRVAKPSPLTLWGGWGVCLGRSRCMG
jgi:hypothetical protein